MYHTFTPQCPNPPIAHLLQCSSLLWAAPPALQHPLQLLQLADGVLQQLLASNRYGCLVVLLALVTI